MTKTHYIFILLIFFALVYLLPLGMRPLLVPDETRYAEIPREMVATGEWVVPHLNGLKYYEKPVMGYWLHGLAQQAFGESNFAVRLPNALATGMVAFLMYCMLAATIKFLKKSDTTHTIRITIKINTPNPERHP